MTSIECPGVIDLELLTSMKWPGVIDHAQPKIIFNNHRTYSKKIILKIIVLTKPKSIFNHYISYPTQN